MEIHTQTLDGVFVAAPQTEMLLASNVQEFRQSVLPLLEDHKKAALDMARVQFMDSSGVGAILSCLRQIEGHGGKLKIYGMSKAVKSVFQITRMNRILDGYDTQGEALSAFRETP